jgi:single-strand DNA-binding protein
MSGVNQINLIGNAGKDPELTVTSSGKSVSKFSLAVSEYAGKDAQGQAQYSTQWFNVIAWNGLAEAVEKLVQKGNSYFVTGRLIIRQYDAKGGGKGVSVEVIANAVTPVGKKGDTDKHKAVTAKASANGLDHDPFLDEEDEFSGL